jgi:hypothetical protein
MRAEPFGKLRTAPVEAPRDAPFDKLRAHLPQAQDTSFFHSN